MSQSQLPPKIPRLASCAGLAAKLAGGLGGVSPANKWKLAAKQVASEAGKGPHVVTPDAARRGGAVVSALFTWLNRVVANTGERVAKRDECGQCEWAALGTHACMPPHTVRMHSACTPFTCLTRAVRVTWL